MTYTKEQRAEDMEQEAQEDVVNEDMELKADLQRKDIEYCGCGNELKSPQDDEQGGICGECR